MKFFKLIKFDLYQGAFKQYGKFIIIFIFLIISCLDFYVQLKAFYVTEYTYGHFLLYIFGGMKEYIPSPSEPFPVPYRWLLWHFLVLYFTLHYMHDDLTGFGQNLIYRCKSRTIWWISKCIWNAIYVSSFYIIGWITVFVFSVLCKAKMSFDITPIPMLLSFGEKQIISEHYNLLFQLTILPLLVSIAVSLIQMTMSLIIKPMLSFVISAVIYISSAYKLVPWLLGNYAMAVRSDLTISNGINSKIGAIFSVLLSLCSIIIGILLFKKYSILNSKEA